MKPSLKKKMHCESSGNMKEQRFALYHIKM